MQNKIVNACRLGGTVFCGKPQKKYDQLRSLIKGETMLLSLALIFIVGMSLGKICELIKLPSLVGMILTGILLGPYALNLLDSSVLDISTQLRQIALIIILARAGMNLDLSELKKVGRPAILMCFVPACFEILGTVIFAPIFFGLTTLESLVLGTVIAAVSPAVIVPRMLKLKDEGYGTKKAIPQLVMAGASVDDVFVIVLFTAFSTLAQTGELDYTSFFVIPTSIIFGILGGVIIGLALSFVFSKIHMADTSKVILMLSISFILVTVESWFTGAIGFSGLLAIMAMGLTLRSKKLEMTTRVSAKFSKLWSAAQILLFVLVGATVDISYALEAGLFAIALIAAVLIFRAVGVLVCVAKSDLNKKERVFTIISYMPKATVQAAIGGLPLAMGLDCGKIVLSVAVVSILLTAPIGAFLIDNTYKKLLQK